MSKSLEYMNSFLLDIIFQYHNHRGICLENQDKNIFVYKLYYLY